jgi:FAD/FMN-containing dehydrogenase
MIERRPLLVVQCADVADVVPASTSPGRKVWLLRCGSHSVAGFGTCDGGLVIDLSRMKGIHVDPVRRVARVDGGCTWGDFDHATHVFGLATPGGIISTTGVGGLTLGGGFGYLTRRYGLACDNLISADVVRWQSFPCEPEYSAGGGVGTLRGTQPRANGGRDTRLDKPGGLSYMLYPL